MKCTQSYMQEDTLMHIVREVTKKQVQLLGDMQIIWERQKIQRKNNADWKNTLEEHILRVKQKKREIYEDFKTGMLVQEDFENEWKQLSAEQENYETEMQNAISENEQEADAISALKKYPLDIFKGQADEIPVGLLDVLIGKIIVFSPINIEIVYTYSDVIKKWHEETGRLQTLK